MNTIEFSTIAPYYDGVTNTMRQAEVRVRIDKEKIAKYAGRAAGNKSGKSRQLQGAVVFQLIKKLQ